MQSLNKILVRVSATKKLSAEKIPAKDFGPSLDCHGVPDGDPRVTQ